MNNYFIKRKNKIYDGETPVAQVMSSYTTKYRIPNPVDENNNIFRLNYHLKAFYNGEYNHDGSSSVTPVVMKLKWVSGDSETYVKPNSSNKVVGYGGIYSTPFVSETIDSVGAMDENGEISPWPLFFPERGYSENSSGFKGILVSNRSILLSKPTGFSSYLGSSSSFHNIENDRVFRGYLSDNVDSFNFFIIYENEEMSRENNMLRNWGCSTSEGSVKVDVLPCSFVKNIYGDALPNTKTSPSIPLITVTGVSNTVSLTAISSDGVEIKISLGRSFQNTPDLIPYPETFPPEPIGVLPIDAPEPAQCTPNACGIVVMDVSSFSNSIPFLPSWRGSSDRVNNNRIIFGGEESIMIRPIGDTIGEFQIGLYNKEDGKTRNLNKNWVISQKVHNIHTDFNSDIELSGVSMVNISPVNSVDGSDGMMWYTVKLDNYGDFPNVSGNEMIFTSSDGDVFKMFYKGVLQSGITGDFAEDVVVSDWQELPPPPQSGGSTIPLKSHLFIIPNIFHLEQTPYHTITADDVVVNLYDQRNINIAGDNGYISAFIVNGNPSLTKEQNELRTWSSDTESFLFNYDASENVPELFAMYGITVNDICNVSGSQVLMFGYESPYNNGNPIRIECSDGSYFQIVVS